MKKNLRYALLSAFALISLGSSAQFEYRIVTSVESIVPGGLGRSRIIDNRTDVEAEDFTTERTAGRDSRQGTVRRRDLKVDELAETKMLNFYSMVGINFQNIASNDALLTSKLNNLAREGWDLAFVASGVESDAGKSDGVGIFITRYIFRRPINAQPATPKNQP